MKEKNVDVVGTVHGRLVGVATHTPTVVNSDISKEMAAWTVAVQLADGTKMLTLFDCITFDSLRPGDVSVPPIPVGKLAPVQWRFKDVTGTATMLSCELLSRHPTLGQRLLANIRTLFDARFEEYSALEVVVSSSTGSDLGRNVALPQMKLWKEKAMPVDGALDAPYPEFTKSTKRATEVLKEAKEWLIQCRWHWEIMRHTMLDTRSDSLSFNEVRALDSRIQVPVIRYDMEVKATLAHKALVRGGMTGKDVERWKTLLADPAKSPWPADLKHINLNTTSGREKHTREFEDLLDRFSIPPDQDCGRYAGATQMHAAAASGFLHIVQVLVKRGADVGSKDAHGNTPLSDALQNGLVHVVKYFMSLGESERKRQLDAQTVTGFTPLAQCATECRSWGNEISPLSLLQSGEFKRFEFARCVLSPAKPFPVNISTYPTPFKIFKILVDAGANANACSKTSGSVVFKLANPEMDDNMMSMAPWMGMGDDAARSKGFMILCVVMALRYVMLESPRRDDVDMKTPVSICRSGHRDWGETEQKSEPILDIALRHPFPEIRRIFARAAAEKEEQKPGSGVSV